MRLYTRVKVCGIKTSGDVDIPGTIGTDAIGKVILTPPQTLSPNGVAVAIEFDNEDITTAPIGQVCACTRVKVDGIKTSGDVDIPGTVGTDAIGKVILTPPQTLSPNGVAVAIEFGNEDITTAPIGQVFACTRVKVCGIKTSGDVDIPGTVGTDAIGKVIFTPPQTLSPNGVAVAIEFGNEDITTAPIGQVFACTRVKVCGIKTSGDVDIPGTIGTEAIGKVIFTPPQTLSPNIIIIFWHGFFPTNL